MNPGSGPFVGPILRSLGATGGLAYGQLTHYLELDAGLTRPASSPRTRPTAADCVTPLAGLPDFALPTLPAGAQATAAAVGLVGGSPAFSVKPLLDEGSAPTGKARLRFVHPSPGTPPVDVGVGSGASFTPVFANVAFPGVAPAGNGVDANGYVETTPLQALVCVDDAPAAGLLTPCSALH